VIEIPHPIPVGRPIEREKRISDFTYFLLWNLAFMFAITGMFLVALGAWVSHEGP
jgi:hypothetical protein